MKKYYIYILSNRNKVLYIGMINPLSRRVFEHKNTLIEGYTKKYNVHSLVYYEIQNYFESAIKRENQLKNWHRQWKINLIESKNKSWKDLYPEIEDPLKILFQ